MSRRGGYITVDIDLDDYAEDFLEALSDEDLIEELRRRKRGDLGGANLADVVIDLERAWRKRDEVAFQRALYDIRAACGRTKPEADMAAAYKAAPKLKDAAP